MTKSVQFEADFAKLSLAKKTSITLELPESCKMEKIVEIARHRGTRLIVHFGDPQMQFDLDEEEMQQSRQQAGVKYDVAANGTVENVQASEDGDQADLLDRESCEDASFDDEDGGEDFDDMSFEEDPPVEDAEEEGDPDETGAETEPTSAAAEPTKEAIEEFILSERPAYLDIPYNFPELLQRKKDGETWIDIAKKLGEPSTKLQAAWSKYKKEVAKQMMGGAA